MEGNKEWWVSVDERAYKGNEKAFKRDRSVKGRWKTLIIVDKEALKGDIEALKGDGKALNGNEKALKCDVELL